MDMSDWRRRSPANVGSASIHVGMRVGLRIRFDPANSALRCDAEGNGAGGAVQFAFLANPAALEAGDFPVM